MELTIVSQPGRFARPFFRSPNTGQQRHYRGDYIDLSDATAAADQLEYLVQHKKVTHAEILQGKDNSRIITTVELAPPPTVALGEPPTTTTSMFSSLPGTRSAMPQPQQPQPPAMHGDMAVYLYQQQEARNAELKQTNEDLRDQLRIKEDTNRAIQRELDEAKLDLKLRDRQHEQDLRDVRAELEGQNAPRGIAGALGSLPPEMGAPLVQGFMGLLGQFMGGMSGGAPAQGAQLALPPGTTPKMHSVAIAATEIFPSEEIAHESMVMMQRIVNDPILYTQFLKLGSQASANQPQYNG